MCEGLSLYGILMFTFYRRWNGEISLILIYTRELVHDIDGCDDKSSYLLNTNFFPSPLFFSAFCHLLDILECINIQLTRHIHVLNSNVSCYKTFFFNNEFNCASKRERKRRRGASKPSELVVIIKWISQDILELSSRYVSG